jgi:predicted anti-sigma-YlaC factor YlaD
MNCRYVREIINSIIDGEGHPLAAEAREHIRECDSCREWHVGMEQTLGLLRSSEAPPMPDIAAMVMSKLPSVHPASRRAGLSSTKALSWLGAGWLLGAVSVAILLIAIWPSVSTNNLGHAINVVRGVVAPLGAALVAVRAAAAIVGHAAMGIARAVGLGPALMAPLFFDLALLAVVLLVWHRRHLAANACLI